MNLLVDGLLVGAAIAVGIAFYRHHTLSAVLASAQKEYAIVEGKVLALAPVVSADVKAALASLKAALKL